MLALSGFVNSLVVDPAPTMASNFVAEFDKGSGQFGVALQRHADPKHRQRQTPCFKCFQDAPDPCTRAVFVNAFHGQVAISEAGRVEHFRQKLFRACVAVQCGVFCAFFVVQNKLKSDPGATRPVGMWWVAAITNQVSGVGKRGIVSHAKSYPMPVSFSCSATSLALL